MPTKYEYKLRHYCSIFFCTWEAGNDDFLPDQVFYGDDIVLLFAFLRIPPMICYAHIFDQIKIPLSSMIQTMVIK